MYPSEIYLSLICSVYGLNLTNIFVVAFSQSLKKRYGHFRSLCLLCEIIFFSRFSSHLNIPFQKYQDRTNEVLVFSLCICSFMLFTGSNTNLCPPNNTQQIEAACTATTGSPLSNKVCIYFHCPILSFYIIYHLVLMPICGFFLNTQQINAATTVTTGSSLSNEVCIYFQSVSMIKCQCHTFSD